MKTVEDNANEFYLLLQQEEQALISLNLKQLGEIRNKKSQYLNWLENLLRNNDDLILLDKKIIEKIKKKNMVLANLYKFSLSLFKKDNNYGKKEIAPVSSLSIKA